MKLFSGIKNYRKYHNRYVNGKISTKEITQELNKIVKIDTFCLLSKEVEGSELDRRFDKFLNKLEKVGIWYCYHPCHYALLLRFK